MSGNILYNRLEDSCIQSDMSPQIWKTVEMYAGFVDQPCSLVEYMRRQLRTMDKNICAKTRELSVVTSQNYPSRKNTVMFRERAAKLTSVACQCNCDESGCSKRNRGIRKTRAFFKFLLLHAQIIMKT